MEEINNKYHISISNEISYWENHVLGKWLEINPNFNCPNCNKNSLKLFKNKKSLANPFLLKCNKKACRKKVNLREGTFFGIHKKVPISVIIKIIEYFILDNKNAVQIGNAIINFYQLDSINMKLIYSILTNVRKYLAQYLKEVYMYPLVEANKSEYVAVDESLFCHTNMNEQIWLIGLINTRNKNFRLEAVTRRDGDILQRIIRQHIGTGNNVVTDGWGAYNWMNSVNSGFNRIIHIHGQHDFGYGEQSTSHIESVWSDLKQKLSAFYVAVREENFILFVKEMEWRMKISHKNNIEKIKNLQFIFNHVANTVKYDLFTLEELKDYEKLDYQFEDDELSEDSEEIDL